MPTFYRNKSRNICTIALFNRIHNGFLCEGRFRFQASWLMKFLPGLWDNRPAKVCGVISVFQSIHAVCLFICPANRKFAGLCQSVVHECAIAQDGSDDFIAAAFESLNQEVRFASFKNKSLQMDTCKIALWERAISEYKYWYLKSPVMINHQIGIYDTLMDSISINPQWLV